MRISQKILIGFGVVLIFFGIVTIINFYQFKKIRNDAATYTRSENILQSSTRLILLSSGIESAVRGYMFGSSSKLKDTFYRLDKAFIPSLKKERDRVKNNTVQVSQLDSILTIYNAWRTDYAIPLINIRNNYLEGSVNLEQYDKVIASKLFQREGRDEMDLIKDIFFRLAREEYRQIDIRAEEVDKSLYWSGFLNVSLMVLAILFSAIIGLLLARNIVRRITEFSNALRSVAQGEFKRHVNDDTKDELGILRNSFNEMTDTLNISFDELKRSNEELEQFTWVASHDLKEPLRMISIYSQKIESEYKGRLDENGKESLKFMTDGVRRMYEVINSLLEYAVLTRDNMNFQAVSPAKAINEAKEKLSGLIGDSNAKISINFLPDSVCASYSSLVEVFFHLLRNAITYCNEPIPAIEISAWQKGERYVFSVKDNGVGIQKEYSERIFMIFQRLQPRDTEPGAGLGLALCKKIIRLHGGEMWLNSEPGKGTTFYFDLPVADKADTIAESFRLPAEKN